MGELQREHATDPRAITMVVLIPGTNAVQDPHGPRGLSVLEKNSPTRRPCGVQHSFHIQARVDVVESPVTVLSHGGWVERIEARRDQHLPDIELDFFIHHLVIDGLRFTNLDALLTALGLEMNAALSIDHGHSGHRLKRGYVDRGVRPQKELRSLALVILNFEFNVRGGTYQRAGAARNARLRFQVERGGHAALDSSLRETDGARADHLVTSPHALISLNGRVLGS